MRTVILAALLFVGTLLATRSPARSQEAGVLLTPEQTRAYHACLTADWVQDYCRSHAWGIFGTYDRLVDACLKILKATVGARHTDSRDDKNCELVLDQRKRSYNSQRVKTYWLLRFSP
jgi:hypothetical protein